MCLYLPTEMRALQQQLFTSLSVSDFTQALAMCGLAVFAARRLHSSPLKQPEQQLAAFLSYLGLPPLPGHQALMAGTNISGGAAAGGGRSSTGEGQKAIKSEQGQFSLVASVGEDCI